MQSTLSLAHLEKLKFGVFIQTVWIVEACSATIKKLARHSLVEENADRTWLQLKWAWHFYRLGSVGTLV